MLRLVDPRSENGDSAHHVPQRAVGVTMRTWLAGCRVDQPVQ